MTSESIPRIAKAAAIIREVVGCDFEWDTPGDRQYGRGALMLLMHPAGSELRAYCNYDCREYDKINKLADALGAIGLMVEDCTGDYSGVYEESI
jgi:hypothetical protein